MRPRPAVPAVQVNPKYAPECRQCRKSMRPVYREVCSVCGQSVYDHRLARAGTPRNKACSLIYTSDELVSDRLKVVKIRRGWGYQANGKFCTRSCAYDWALEHAK